MAFHLPFEILSHKRRVCSLFKRASRSVEDRNEDRTYTRILVTIIRGRFDKNKDVTDPNKMEKLVCDGEEELLSCEQREFKKWPKTIQGNAYGRAPTVPDWVLDYWHPLEKAQYPKYFATREKRKEEFIKMWDEEYGKPDSCKKSDH